MSQRKIDLKGGKRCSGHYISSCYKMASFAILLPLVVASSLGESTTCSKPLGLEDSSIPDTFITASSSYSSTVGPAMARLRGSAGAGAWCPEAMVGGVNSSQQFLEVELPRRMLISGLETQGRWDEGRGQEFVPWVALWVFRDGEGWVQYRDKEGREEWEANRDTYSVVKISLEPAVEAERVRVVPRARHSRTVCLRLELLGCPVQRAGEDKVEDVTTIVKEVPGHSDWSVHLPVALGVLLTTSMILLVVIISILLRMTRSKQLAAASPQTIYISRPSERDMEGDYMSNWYLHLSKEPVYQEPSMARSVTTSTFQAPSVATHYSVPLVPNSSSQVYSEPTTTARVDSSPSSTLSNQSTVHTDISCLEESGVDSTPSTPRLPAWSRDLVDVGILPSTPFFSHKYSNIV